MGLNLDEKLGSQPICLPYGSLLKSSGVLEPRGVIEDSAYDIGINVFEMLHSGYC